MRLAKKYHKAYP